MAKRKRLLLSKAEEKARDAKRARRFPNVRPIHTTDPDMADENLLEEPWAYEHLAALKPDISHYTGGYSSPEHFAEHRDACAMVEEHFMQISSTIRSHVKNDAAQFIAWLLDPLNAEECDRLVLPHAGSPNAIRMSAELQAGFDEATRRLPKRARGSRKSGLSSTPARPPTSGQTPAPRNANAGSPQAAQTPSPPGSSSTTSCSWSRPSTSSAAATKPPPCSPKPSR